MTYSGAEAPDRAQNVVRCQHRVVIDTTPGPYRVVEKLGGGGTGDMTA
jgi:hypothetical protein